MQKVVIDKILKCLPKLNSLDLGGNYLNPITSNLFSKDKNIRKIILSDCKLSSIRGEIFSSIQEIDLQNNYFQAIPKDLISSKLKVLKMGKPRLSQNIEQFEINPNITSIPTIEELNFSYLSFNIKSFEGMGHHSPNLKILKFENCFIQFHEFNRSLKERGGIFKRQFPNLKILSLKNTIYTPKYYFKFEDFHGMKYLEEMDLSGLPLHPNKTPREKIYEGKLRKIYLIGSLKYRLEAYHLEEFKNLEVLDLSNNAVDTCDNGSVLFNQTSHTQLTSLILRKNRVPFCLTEEMTELFCRLKYLDMTETLFKCSEAISYFYIISLKCPVKIVNFKGGNGYFCHWKSEVISFINFLSQSSGEETFIPRIHKNKIPLSNWLLTISFIGGVVLISLLIMMGVYFKVRSNWLYLKFIITKQNKKLITKFNLKTISGAHIQSTFEYDAFVSYDSRDEKWIDKDLLPNVENNSSNMKLCVHTRDFIPGKSIAENIVESLEKSRACIVILSDSYLESKWCRFEYQLAYDLMQRQPFRDLILVKKGLKLRTKSRMIRELKYFLCTHTYLEWREDFNEKNKKNFWSHLHKSLIKKH
nr:toll-like receptor 6 [Lepeophtheirus salmonis]